MTGFRFTKFLSLIWAVLVLAGCAFDGSRQTKAPTTASFYGDPSAVYLEAIQEIMSAENLSLYIGTTKETAFPEQTFTLSTQQRLNLQGIGSEDLRGSMEETMRIGTYCVEIAELFEKEQGYVIVDGNTFVTPLSANDYCARLSPAVLLNQSLYQDIQATVRGSYTCIAFSQASAAEDWAMPPEAEFIEACGYAVINELGKLKESTYTLSYTLGTATITQTTKSLILSGNSFQFQSPAASGTQISIDHMDVPIILERACGYLLQAENVQSTATTDIACEIFAISRTKTTDLTISGTGKNFSASLDVLINQKNQSHGGEATQIKQSEKFNKGRYSITSNGNTTKNDDVDANTMRTYCQDILIQDILLPEHIASAAMTESENHYTITFQGSAQLSEAICSKISSTLYSDPQLLHTLSSEYNTEVLQCVLTLDKFTGLPLSFSSAYSANHTIEAITYGLESKTEQSYKYEKVSG